MDERRQFVRIDTRLEVQYTLLPSGRAKASVTKNVSAGGICLFAEQRLPIGQVLQVSLKLLGREQPVNFTGEVRWCEEYETIGKTTRQRSIEAGVQFVEIAPQDRDAIMQHVILSVQPPRTPAH